MKISEESLRSNSKFVTAGKGKESGVIGYLGPIGTYSYEACRSYIEDNYEILPFKTITQTISELEEGRIDKAILPIENSTEGGVSETIDGILTYPNLNIVGELTLKINHCLLSKGNTIEEIYSHPQAIAQCRNYLSKNYPHVDIKEVASTTVAATEAKEKENSACIASKSCSQIYGLNILDTGINDKDNNETRFIILSKKEGNEYKSNKVSIIFSTKNEPGELYKVLGLFNIFNINLTKIESRPAKTKLGEYVFWIDFIGNKSEEHIQVLLKQIKEKCSYFRILGGY